MKSCLNPLTIPMITTNLETFEKRLVSKIHGMHVQAIKLTHYDNGL
jgi:hypothetical protein